MGSSQATAAGANPGLQGGCGRWMWVTRVNAHWPFHKKPQHPETTTSHWETDILEHPMGHAHPDAVIFNSTFFFFLILRGERSSTSPSCLLLFTHGHTYFPRQRHPCIPGRDWAGLETLLCFLWAKHPFCLRSANICSLSVGIWVVLPSSDKNRLCSPAQWDEFLVQGAWAALAHQEASELLRKSH